MKKHDDPNYVVKVEKAIAEKYGEAAVQHPRSDWTEEKEKDYLEQLKRLAKKEKRTSEKNEKVEKSGFLISKKLLKKKVERECPRCNVYSFDARDDLYMNKFECCWECYIKYVEHGVEREKMIKWLEENPDYEEENENHETKT